MRTADGREDVLSDLAAELVRDKVDLILTSGTAAVRASRRATATIPIVFANSADPVAEGFVASLARPGGNSTGLTMGAGEESAKRLELLKETVPGLSRVAVLWTQPVARSFTETETAAHALGIEVISLELERPLRVLKYRLRGRSDGQLHVHAQVTKTLHQSVGNTFFVALVEVGVAEILIDTAGAQDVENNDQD